VLFPYHSCVCWSHPISEIGIFKPASPLPLALYTLPQHFYRRLRLYPSHCYLPLSTLIYLPQHSHRRLRLYTSHYYFTTFHINFGIYNLYTLLRQRPSSTCPPTIHGSASLVALNTRRPTPSTSTSTTVWSVHVAGAADAGKTKISRGRIFLEGARMTSIFHLTRSALIGRFHLDIWVIGQGWSWTADLYTTLWCLVYITFAVYSMVELPTHSVRLGAGSSDGTVTEDLYSALLVLPCWAL